MDSLAKKLESQEKLILSDTDLNLCRTVERDNNVVKSFDILTTSLCVCVCVCVCERSI